MEKKDITTTEPPKNPPEKPRSEKPQKPKEETVVDPYAEFNKLEGSLHGGGYNCT